MNIKKAVKRSIFMCIDCDLNPITIVIRGIKNEIREFVDKIIPDDETKANDWYILGIHNTWGITMDIALFMLGTGFIGGMIFVWAFGFAHDMITNFYRRMIYERELKKEKKLLEQQTPK